MGVFRLILTLAGIGLFGWAVTKYIPMTDGAKQVIQVVVIVVIGWIALAAFGLLPSDVAVPRFN